MSGNNFKRWRTPLMYHTHAVYYRSLRLGGTAFEFPAFCGLAPRDQQDR